MKKIVPIIFLWISLLPLEVRGQLADIRKLQQELPLIRDSLRYADALNRLGMLFYESNVDSTFYYTLQARDISDRSGYARGKADAATNLGVVYDMKGNLQLGLRYYHDAYMRYVSIHDPVNIVQSIANIAMVYQEQGKDQKAIASYKAAIAMGEKLHQDSIMSLVWYNYILQYPGSTPQDSIPIYIDHARQIAARYGDKRVLLAIEQLIADNYIRNNKRDTGIALLQQSVAKAMQSGMYYCSMDMLIDLGSQYDTAEPARAAACYEQGLTIARQKRYLVYMRLFARKLYDLYTAKKDLAMVAHYSQVLLALQEEQERLDNSSGVDYIEYALKEQQLGSAELRSGYRLKFLILAVAMCIVALIGLVVLWRNWRQLRSTARALRLQFERSELATEALDAKNKDYARLIQIVAHDLRNPLIGISTVISMIQAKETEPEETPELMDLVQVSSRNCLELINELLATDLEQQHNFKEERVDLGELLQQCVQLLAFKAKDKDQQLVLTSTGPATILGDREKLWRVINNLIVNALKFSAAGSKVTIDTSLQEHKAIIAVTDTGIGIPADMQGKIFDPFTTARRHGTQGEQPFGLGLYISKQIVEAHKGRIWFRSEEDKGTTFYVELPVVG